MSELFVFANLLNQLPLLKRPLKDQNPLTPFTIEFKELFCLNDWVLMIKALNFYFIGIAFFSLIHQLETHLQRGKPEKRSLTSYCDKSWDDCCTKAVGQSTASLKRDFVRYQGFIFIAF
jgi:hypothetical protein